MMAIPTYDGRDEKGMRMKRGNLLGDRDGKKVLPRLCELASPWACYVAVGDAESHNLGNLFHR